MKKVEAVIREERLEAVKKALEECGCTGMTVSEVSGRGRQKGLPLPSRRGEYRVDLLPKLKLEIVVVDEDTTKIVDAIMGNARTGDIGDGKIFILPVEEVMRVRTGEKGGDAV